MTGRETGSSNPRVHASAIYASPIHGILLLALLTFAGCAGSASYVHPEADLAFYEKVGVLPFASLTNDRLAGDKMGTAFSTALLISGRMNLVEPGQFLSAYQNQIGTTTAAPIGLPLDKLKVLAEATGVQGVFEGTVREFEAGSGASGRPLISIEVRLVDVATGNIVWSTGLTRRARAAIPILNLGGTRTLAELADVVADALIARLPE